MMRDFGDPMPLIASVSGGKDSAAMCLHFKELGIPYRAVFMDTGWESPVTYDYLRDVLDPAIGPIEWIDPPLGMTALIIKKGMFASRVRRFCTQELKIFPFLRWIKDQYPAVPVCNAVGIRAGESRARALMPYTSVMAETGGLVANWRPLLTWTTEDVVDIHRRHNLTPNPLYLRGAERVGCWPCIFARKSEIRLIADQDPERMDKIRHLESVISDMAGDKRTFFDRQVAKGGGREDVRADIDNMVEWSRTSRGGKQFEMFADDPESGCMRWGMCE